MAKPTGEALLKHVLQVTRHMAEARALDPLLRYVIDEVLQLVGAEQGVIVLWAPETAELEFKISRTHEGQAMPAPKDEISLSILSEVIETGQSLMLQNAMTNPRFSQAGSVMQLRLRSIMCVPLLSRNNVIGAIYVENRTVQNRFRETDIAPLELFANQAAIAIENATLNDENQHYATELEERVSARTKELAQANQRLTELDQLKSKFVSDVSHELRTPITNLSLYIDLLTRGKPEMLPKYRAILKQEIARLQHLVEDILDLSRLEMGRDHALKFESVDLNQVVAPVVTVHQPRAEASGLHLSFLPTTDLPPVWGEWNQLAQALTNLIANAINYTPSGHVIVSTSIAENGCFAGIQVTDTGIGITTEDMPYLFDRFYRGKSISGLSMPGTGLGLAIIKEIIDLHSGTIDVHSTLGQGSTFQIWLPILENPPPD